MIYVNLSHTLFHLQQNKLRQIQAILALTPFQPDLGKAEYIRKATTLN